MAYNIVSKRDTEKNRNKYPDSPIAPLMRTAHDNRVFVCDEDKNHISDWNK